MRAETDAGRTPSGRRCSERPTVEHPITTLTDRWDEMDAEQRRRGVATVFSEITMEDGHVEATKAHADWLEFVERSVGAAT